MTQKSDKALLRRYHEHGDLAAREQLIEQYMSLVRSLARRYSYRGGQLEDLVQIGAIEASVGPFRARSVQRALEAEDDGVGLRRVLDTVVDRVEVDERDGGDWVQLTKRIDEQKRNGAA